MFRISPTSVGRIINETCIAIWTILLAKEYINYPKGEDESKAIANNDGGVFKNSKTGIAFESNLLHIPESKKPNGSNVKLPYVLIRDEAFPLKNDLMKPYPKEILSLKERIYNYRLSRARRIIENTFGILAARCRIFRKPIIANKKTVVNVTKAATALHNYLMHRQFEPLNQYCPLGFVDYETSSGLLAGEWRSNVSDY
ncbi:uncharacterized protein LOC136074434 [Hydra vulgaris]|uniref:Uncharacterized protein LOC136074434 n=1 Tax=Hydra vulgaris TaxID=6087 RepID=A0ABM4B203_HYDVU